MNNPTIEKKSIWERQSAAPGLAFQPWRQMALTNRGLYPTQKVKGLIFLPF
ncbi:MULTISPECIES: hypothetical protein [Cupriavidus]